MRRLLFFFIFILSLLGGIQISHLGRMRDAYRAVCDLTQTHFYKADEQLNKWVRECRMRAARFRNRSSEPELLRDIQDHMNELQVSHFQIYDPNEDKRLWQGESTDTGIRARFVEDMLIVYKVEKDSAAFAAGVLKGDQITEIANAEQVTPWGAMRRTGRFVLRRRGVDRVVDIQARTLRVDSSPKLQALSVRTALLDISSFRSEYFTSEKWLPIVSQLNGFSHVILDLRENSGGSFVAMLRALSTFHCSGFLVGTIKQPRKALPGKLALDDDLSDAHQIAELEKFSNLGLRTFANYGCYKGRVSVLISAETSSVAEIFAQSFKQRKLSRVWGQPTSGDVILAVWYDLPTLGAGYSVSIPEAIYLTADNQDLEGRGVSPQKELYYDLELSLLGRDNWIERATIW